MCALGACGGSGICQNTGWRVTVNSEIGWRFPPTNGGRADGFNDPGIAHFSGEPLGSLTREAIQNSLDAKRSLGEPVHIDFELKSVSVNEIGGQELLAAISACKNVPGNEDRVTSALQTAETLLHRPEISILRVSDRNTTGLQGERWRALVKAQGWSFKPDLQGAGGSHGIGKYAPFAVSGLRTVFYWTCYQENGKDLERFQGKCVLMSHEGEEGETQGTGFYGIKDQCHELRNGSIPSAFRILRQGKQPVHGTSVAIAGFTESNNWRRRIATSVLENFFFAIWQGELTIRVEPMAQDDLFEIEKGTLAAWFDSLQAEETEDDDGDEGSSALSQSRVFWEASMEPPAAEKQDADLGHCRLWIRVADGLPRKVGFVRRTGMLVTSRQRRLLNFPGYRDFAALCVFEDPDGNELLRRMENAEHNQFEPNRLPEEERDRGQRALRRITDWIRGEVRKYAGPPEGGKSSVLRELATYLPDLEPDEPFEDDGGAREHDGEPGFAQRVTLALRPVRRVSMTTLELDEQDDEGGDGDGVDTGDVGGGGTGTNEGEGGDGGSGEGEGTGGTGTRGGGKVKQKSIPVSSVRVLAVNEGENKYLLSFLPRESGTARLQLSEAGDSSAIQRDDVCVATSGELLEGIDLKLVGGQLTEVEITANAPIGGRSWRLTAIAAEAT